MATDNDFKWPENVIPCWFDEKVWNAIIHEFKAGKSVREIADILQTHESYIICILRKKAGIKRDLYKR